MSFVMLSVMLHNSLITAATLLEVSSEALGVALISSVQENNGSELIKSIKIQDKGNRQSLIVNLPARSWQENGLKWNQVLQLYLSVRSGVIPNQRSPG